MSIQILKFFRVFLGFCYFKLQVLPARGQLLQNEKRKAGSHGSTRGFPSAPMWKRRTQKEEAEFEASFVLQSIAAKNVTPNSWILRIGRCDCRLGCIPDAE